MPLSSNAPFNEFGQSMVLRDIEQLYLITGGGQAPSAGSVGEAGSQEAQVAADQTTAGGGGPASPLVTQNQLNTAVSAAVSYPISIANGGTSATTLVAAMLALGIPVTGSEYRDSGTSWTIPSGAQRVVVVAVGGGAGNNATNSATVNVYVASTSGGSPTTGLAVGTLGGASGSAVVAIIDTDGLSSLTYAIGAGGAGVTSGASGAGGSTTVTATGVAITAKGGTAVSGVPGQPDSTSTVSGAAVKAYITIPGNPGGRSSLSASFGSTTAFPPVFINGVAYGSGGIYNTSAASNGSLGAILFIY